MNGKDEHEVRRQAVADLFYFNKSNRTTQNTFFAKERNTVRPAGSQGHFLPNDRQAAGGREWARRAQEGRMQFLAVEDGGDKVAFVGIKLPSPQAREVPQDTK